MRTPRKKTTGGFTLVELSVVIFVVIALASGAMYGFSNFQQYRKQLQAEAGLNAIAAAQRAYLLEHPTMTYSNISSTTMLLQYLPGGTTPIMPPGATIKTDVFPPTATDGQSTWSAREY